MIKGVHTMFYSSEAEKLRIFLRDKLGFTATDIGEGWLIFDLPEADMGVHPAMEISPDTPFRGPGQVSSTLKEPPSGTHDISFYCEDIVQTVKELKEKGVEFKGEIEDQEFGLITFFKVPGNFYLQLYQPNYSKK